MREMMVYILEFFASKWTAVAVTDRIDKKV